MERTEYGPFSILISQSHWEDRWLDAKGGYGRIRVEDPPKKANVTVSIDVMEIARRLGAKASKSKSGKATGLWGLVVVREARK